MGSFILPSALSREGKFPAVPSLPGPYICAQNGVTTGSFKGMGLLSWLGIRGAHRDLEHLFQKGSRVYPYKALGLQAGPYSCVSRWVTQFPCCCLGDQSCRWLAW